MSNLGEINSYDESELVIFDEGIFGFEDYKKFLPLPIDEENHDFLCLLSVEDEHLSFIIANPFSIYPCYSPILSKDDFKKLGTDREEELSYFTICVVGNVPENSTLNLKCPIVVNSKTRKAVQVILQTEDYSLRHKISDLKKKAV